MCRKLIYPTLFLLALAATVGQAADLTWIRAAYFDAKYPSAWAGAGNATRDALAAAGYTILNANELKTWMDARIADKKLSVVVMTQDVVPDTVAETETTSCTIRRYLDTGGKVVWYADWPFYYQGKADGTMVTWGSAGATSVLGFNAATGPNDSMNVVTLTPDGIKWGLTLTWQSQRPTSPTVTPNLTVLAKDNVGNAAAWVKHFLPNDHFRGFVRFRDTGGQATAADIMRVAEFIDFKASAPDPVDGATNVNMPLLQWSPSSFALFHNVYLGTTPELTEANLVGAKQMFTMLYLIQGLQPGTTYYWRVDEIEADMTTVHTGDMWSFIAQAAIAYHPTPTNNAGNVSPAVILTWLPGVSTLKHHLYLSDDLDAVKQSAAGADKGELTDATYTPPDLQGGTTYYWRVDELIVGGAVKTGEVWSFTTFVLVDDMESYTDDEGSRIYETWVDGWTNGTGSTVGNTTAPFAERTIIHGGKQSMPMDYNNTAAPFYSEAEQEFSPLQNWTVGDVNTLSLWFRGSPVRYADKGNGDFTVGASGHDIWDNADDFRFVYKSLNGNGSVTVKVESLVNTNAWAKAGVMIRESLDAGSPMAYMIQSYSSGVSFGWRLTSAATCGSQTQASIVAPQWVKLTRTGNAFTAQYSADGKTWTDIKDTTGKAVSTTISMAGNVYIGLCVTSHDSAATTIAQLSGAAATGTVTGSWKEAWIGDDPDRTNSTAGLYAVVGDSAGKSVVVTHSDPTAVNLAAWTQWKIPLSSLTGVNLAKVKKLYIGVGDRKTPVADGFGRLYIDDIQVMKP